MYENILNAIKNDTYKLGEMLEKIDTMYIKGKITKEQMEELEGAARENANPENNYKTLQEQINEIYKFLIEKEINPIKERLKALEGEKEPEEPTEEYPEYVQPGGAYNAYKRGDKITYKGKKYICIAPEGQVCVYSSEEYPVYWEEVKEEA